MVLRERTVTPRTILAQTVVRVKGTGNRTVRLLTVGVLGGKVDGGGSVLCVRGDTDDGSTHVTKKNCI